jgi:hypothetical protein
MAEVTLFAGPSAHGLEAAVLQEGGVSLRPPAARGDIAQLVAAERPGVVVLCDGVFQSQPAVSHAELCQAIDAGWRLWGVSSLGAIRAHELRDEGMHGAGWVHGQFAQHDDFTDDELCLLHFPEPPWFPVSEALVNLRYALQRAGPALGIGSASSARLITALRGLWFGDRTPATMRELMAADADIPPGSADRLLCWLQRHRVKTLDLAHLMARRPWKRPPPPSGR